MSRVFCRRGIPCGAVSHSFTAEDLLDALKGNDNEHVYVELDGAGRLREEGARAAGGAGAARLCVRARLAPHEPAAGLAVVLAAPPSPPALRLRAAALAPHAELLLWFAPCARAALGLPHLAPRHIRGRRAYVCHACGAAFADPNPLKAHLFLACAAGGPAALWRRVAARLAAPASPAPALLPAQLEALATAWGRSPAGHACVYCGKLYSRRYGLKIHLRTHTGYRPLRCRHCLRAFGDPSNLNKHERLHAARPAAALACGVCGRVLARRRDLQRHARTHGAGTLSVGEQ